MSEKPETGGCRVIVKNIALPYTEPAQAALEEAKKKLSRAGLRAGDLCVNRRSVDARRKGAVKFVYSVSARLDRSPGERTLEKHGFTVEKEAAAPPSSGSQRLSGRVIVTGFGPCGMFAALALAQAGYRPLVLERGDRVSERREKVKRFFATGELDENCNVQFGAGGAGTFSDGKLMTRINDPLCRRVTDVFLEFGAPESIGYLARPHVGTDKLMPIVDGIASKIEELGGEVLYRTTLTGLVRTSSGEISAVKTTSGDFPCGALILATGHSARDTCKMLLRDGFSVVGKDFSVGARVEHLQSDIDAALYGDADLSILGHAEYSLSLRENGRGVYSFCMCPGGEVICSSSGDGELVVNGMSNYLRSGRNANSAIAVSVLKSDYGEKPEKAMEYQRAIERRAFEAAGGGFRAPLQTMGDFLSGRSGSAPSRVVPTFRGGDFLTPCDLHGILPPHVTAFMEKGFAAFDREIPGFASPDALLTGVETRTSSPVRILRCEDQTSPDCKNLYPAGEGAGYAGGITSAAVDGLRAAYAVIARYRPEIG